MPSPAIAVLRRRAVAETDAGFSLLEVIVSFLIFAIVATCATYSVINGSRAEAQTRRAVVATNLAQQAVEQARVMDQSELIALDHTSTTTSTDTGSYSLAWTVGFTHSGDTSCPTSLAAGTVHTITVQVVVTPSNVGDRTVTMNTVIACRA